MPVLQGCFKGASRVLPNSSLITHDETPETREDISRVTEASKAQILLSIQRIKVSCLASFV